MFTSFPGRAPKALARTAVLFRAYAPAALFLTTLFVALVWSVSNARADAPSDAVAPANISSALRDLASTDSIKVREAITALGASGHPRALEILRAMEEQRLKVDATQHILIEGPNGTLDAESGVTRAAEGPTTVFTLNNVLRRALAPAMAQLRLVSGNAEERLFAANELVKRPTEELRPVMVQTLEREQDSKIRDSLELALAELDILRPDSASKLRALKTIERSGEVSLKSAIEPFLVQDASGVFNEPDPQVREVARSTLKALERRIFFIGMVANLIYGLSLGSVLLLAALGLAITFGLMRVINMAHGEMLMIGAYATFTVQNLFLKYMPNHMDWYLVAAIPSAFITAGLVGIALERSVIRFLYGRPLETLLATWGISLLLIQTVRLAFGAQNVAVANPTWLSGGFDLLPGVVLPYSRIATILFVCIVVGFVWFLLQRTRLGLYVRAVTQNREMACSMGIPAPRIDMWTFGFGSGVAGLGGVALSQLGNVGPELGQGYIVDSFMVVVLGGVGKIAGTIVGAVGLGVVNKFLEPLAGAVLGKIFVLVFIILFIQKRPQGIFALKGRAAEL